MPCAVSLQKRDSFGESLDCGEGSCVLLISWRVVAWETVASIQRLGDDEWVEQHLMCFDVGLGLLFSVPGVACVRLQRSNGYFYFLVDGK